MNVSVSGSRGLVNQSNDHFLETTLNANNQIEITSGNDTHLQGGQVFGEQVTANVGGDLNIISQQDEEHYEKEQESWGVNIGVGIGAGAPVTASVNYSELEADSAYVAVQEQSGIFAGDSGFAVNVGGKTHLEGAATVSSADSEQNPFSTETLTYDRIENHAEYAIESNSVSFSTSVGGNSNNSPRSPIGLSGGNFSDSGSASNTTDSMISDGNIEIRETPNMSLDDLREADDRTHQVLTPIFNEGMVADAEETAQLAALFAEEGFRLVGELYADQADAQ